ncbi:hypothetical protein DL769_011516 [Monosporascus sp. CRB-8-3]|nr:hypothetical protein DL769_011516 [Monosporascus sp. CRB-8-3]
MRWSVVGTGAPSFMTCTDKKTVLKSHQVWEDGETRPLLSVSFEDALRRKAFMYQHLGTHPIIPACHALEEIHPGDTPPPVGVCLDMTLDAARALGHLHPLSVQHSDVSCRNLLPFDNHRAKLCDFGSSLIQGQAFDATNYEETAYELPLRGRTLKGRPVTKRELSALEPLIYEIMAWVKPLEGDGITEIEQKLAQEVFPRLEGVR